LIFKKARIYPSEKLGPGIAKKEGRRMAARTEGEGLWKTGPAPKPRGKN